MSLLGSIVEMDYAISRNALEWIAEGPSVFRGIMAPGVGNSLVKGAVPAAVFWYLWFSEQDQRDRRLRLISTLLTTVIAIAIGRLLANMLPFRTRPLASFDVMGTEVQQSSFLEEWSSMPSDHALMFFAMASCIFMISRMAGIFLFVHAALFVSMPRVLYGFHYLSDIVVGAILGIVISAAVMPLALATLRRHNHDLKWKPPARIGYPLLFLITFQFATMFDASRDLLSRMAKFLGL